MPEDENEGAEALGEAARRVLLSVHGGSRLTRSQTAGGCLFWFLDGSVIDEAGPRELQVRELIALRLPGSAEPVSLTERGRSLAERLEGPDT